MDQQKQVFKELDSFVKSSLSTHVDLEVILIWNAFGSKTVSALGLELANCRKIENLKLCLYQNDIADHGLTGLNFAFECFQLKKLDYSLGGNLIGPKGATELGITLSLCTELQDLNLELWDNRINEGVLGISSVLAKIPNLSHLELNMRQNKIRSKGTLDIGDALKYCTKLKFLSFLMSDNDIGFQDVSTLGQNIARYPSLIYLKLDLHYNSLGTVQKGKLTKRLLKTKRLTKLMLHL
ncbi:hypothetical protein ABPG73_004720 [Tetrahymena malaccensis]